MKLVDETMKFEVSELACAPPNQSTFTHNYIFLDNLVLGANLKCLLDFSICLSSEYYCSLEPPGSLCKQLEARTKTTPQKGKGRPHKRNCLGTERPLGCKVATCQSRQQTPAARLSVPRPQGPSTCSLQGSGHGGLSCCFFNAPLQLRPKSMFIFQ